MSSVGPFNPAGFNLAGSLAGAQRTSGDKDQTAAERAAQKQQAEQTANAEKDVSETDMSPDRDADGRQDFSSGGSAGDEQDSTDEISAPGSDTLPDTPAPDAFGERGNSLDLNA